jgi:hypothetical protein
MHFTFAELQKEVFQSLLTQFGKMSFPIVDLSHPLTPSYTDSN